MLTPRVVNTSVVFWKSDVRVGEEAAFQISLAAPSDAAISALPIHSISISFSEGYTPVVIHHDVSTHSEAVRLVSLGQITGEQPVEVGAYLRWRPGDQIILTGTLTSDVPGVFSVCIFLFLFSSHDDRIDGVGLDHCGNAERRELDDRGTARALCVARIESRRSSVVKFGATRILYSRDKERLCERHVSAQVPPSSSPCV